MAKQTNFQLSNISFWGDSLGLLPTKLTVDENNKYILLNGGSGDFCLQLKNQIRQEEYYHSAAWSSNTKNFVVYDKTNLTVFNWKKKKIERLKPEVVKNNFLSFYDYLVNNSINSESDVVPFIINIFKQLRNLTDEKRTGVEALNLLFLLLASLKEDITKIDRAKWGLQGGHIPKGFENYIEQFQKGLPGITPNLDLILRHSAGLLFQEAHKEAIFFYKQMDLFSSTLPGDYELRKLMYSSVHYTPSYIARAIVENALKKVDKTKRSLKILDPACGSSELLIETLRQLNNCQYAGKIQVNGMDTSQTAINTSTFLLTYEKSAWKNKYSMELKLVKDSLQEDWGNDNDIILMNPPFVSWELMTKEERESVMATLNNLVTGKPNQASAFIYKATQALKIGGILGCVTPSSLFSFSAYSNLREMLQEVLNFVLIGKLGNFVFENALTDISILIAEKSDIKGSPTIVWARNERGVPSEALRDLRKFEKNSLPYVSQKNYSVYKADKFPLTKTNWKLLSYKENETIKKIDAYIFQGTLVKVSDIFNVRQGIRTGNNKVFKIPEYIYRSLPNEEKLFFRPAIDNDAIERGKIKINNYVWFPYSEEGLLINSEDELQEKVPNYYATFLLPHRDALLNRARKNVNNWWVLSEHRDWLLTKQPRLISTEFGKSDSFAFDKEGQYVVERGNAWIPIKKFKHINSYYFYLAIFSSPFFDSLLSIYSKQLAGGNWYDLGNKFTQNIPIPSVLSENIYNTFSYEKVVEIGKQISLGNLFHLGVLDEMVTKYFYSADT